MLRDERPIASVQSLFDCLVFDPTDKFATTDFFRLLKEVLARGSKGIVKLDCCSLPSFESFVLRRRLKMLFDVTFLFCEVPSTVRSDARPDASSGKGEEARALSTVFRAMSAPAPMAAFISHSCDPDTLAASSRGTASSNICAEMIGDGGKDRFEATMSNGEIGVAGPADVEEVADSDKDGTVTSDSRVDDVEGVF